MEWIPSAICLLTHFGGDMVDSNCSPLTFAAEMPLVFEDEEQHKLGCPALPGINSLMIDDTTFDLTCRARTQNHTSPTHHLPCCFFLLILRKHIMISSFLCYFILFVFINISISQIVQRQKYGCLYLITPVPFLLLIVRLNHVVCHAIVSSSVSQLEVKVS